MVFLCRTFSFRNNIREKKLSKFFQGFSRCITKYSNTDTDFLKLRNIKRIYIKKFYRENGIRRQRRKQKAMESNHVKITNANLRQIGEVEK